MQLRPWIILAALALGRVAFGYQFQTIASLATDLIGRYGLSYAQIGDLIGIYNLLGVFVALPLGLLGRRFGDRLVMGGGLLLMTAGAGLGAWAEGPPMIAAGRAAAGAGAVAMIVLQGKIIADWFTGPRFMIAISVSACSFPIGMGLAGLALPPVLAHLGLRAALLSDTIPAGLALLLFLAGYREPTHVAQVPRRFSLPGRQEVVLLLVAGLVWTAYTSAYSAFLSYLPASLSGRGYGVPLIGLVMTIATWGNVPATMLGGGLAARIGGFRVFLAGSLSLAIGMAGSALFGWPVAWALVLGVLGSVHPGVIMAIGTLSARPENRTVGMSLFYTLYYLGGSVAPTVCGVVADAAGRPEGGLLTAAAISLLAIPIYMLHRSLASHGTMLMRA